MTESYSAYPLTEGRELAEFLVESMRENCERIEIAGSIRREKEYVKDIEILAVPSFRKRPTGLFGEELYNALYENLMSGELANDFNIRWIKPGVSEVEDWRISPSGKYWRGLLPNGMKLDLFLCKPDNWGIMFLIRTGSAAFSKAAVTRAKLFGTPCENGYLTVGGKPAKTFEEEDAFQLLNMEWLEPRFRIDEHSIMDRRNDKHFE